MNGGIFIQVLIWGQDSRFNVLESELRKKHNVDWICDYEIDIKKYDIIILPMKGVVDSRIIELLKKSKESVVIYTGLKNNLNNINREVISFLDDKSFQEENNNITVDGIINYIINIKHDKICLLGYGNIGKKLYKKLNNQIFSIGIVEKQDKLELGNISFYTYDKDIMKEKLNDCDLIINTVPNNIITSDIAKNLNTFILDISSYPYGVDKNVIDDNQLNYYLYSGIPGKYDPNRAGKIMLKKIIRGE